MFKKTVQLSLMAGALVLGGCVIAVGTDEYHNKHSSVDTRQAVSDLALGTSMEKAKLTLGAPKNVEAFKASGGEYRVLYYKLGEGLTPLVFFNGQLEGIGDLAMNEAKLKGDNSK